MTERKTALVVIDVQNAVLSFPGMTRLVETNHAFDECVAKIVELVSQARRHRVPILFVQHDGSAGHRLEPGLVGWQIRPELAPALGELVIHKKASDAFFETKLGPELDIHNVNHLVAVGCMTQYCVDTTVRRAVTLGYDVTLVKDGHMTTDSDNLTFNQIIAHHNELLDGFGAGACEVRVIPANKIVF